MKPAFSVMITPLGQGVHHRRADFPTPSSSQHFSGTGMSPLLCLSFLALGVERAYNGLSPINRFFTCRKF